MNANNEELAGDPKTRELLEALAAQLESTKYRNKPQGMSDARVGDVYYLFHPGRRRTLSVLSVTVTHVYVKYEDTGFQLNIPHDYLTRWTKLESTETEASE